MTRSLPIGRITILMKNSRDELPAKRSPATPPAASNVPRTQGPELPSLRPQICPSPREINLNPAVFARPLLLLALRPREAWLIIRDEPLTATQIFERYVFLLAAIGPISGSVGFYMTGRLTGSEALATAASSYALVLMFFFGAVYLAHLAAPAFAGSLSLDRAAKLIVYSFMPFFVFLAFFLIPPLCFLSLIGVYGIVLFFRGIPIMSTIPGSRQLLFIMVNAVTWIFFVEMVRCSIYRP